MAKSDTVAGDSLGVALDQHEINGDHIENDTELGSVHIHNNVIATIARLAAIKVPGVSEMSGGIVDDLAGIIRSKKSGDRGIRVTFEDSGVVIEIHVILDYGVRIPHVAWQLQTEVRQAVEQMTGKHVKAVQVVVQGVKLPTDAERGELRESAG
ncbi:MAG TPA: Asp23/Gls24 family envelope stress response protein [Kiritimatiellia bacterium]|nr:Asp23/Gls24 family envelope stress response protein [Kiritimatiellia bacterium]HMO97945.1 Asp23/Gls24 family envelope stress response protein [Kiritimatiellia bacterium]HMP95296.1 Asp23/Gls24 family envelope stress response protein [Kiritimatiellia bacterium]